MMRKYKNHSDIFCGLIVFLLAALLLAGCQASSPTTAETTAAPPQTTVSPTTTAPAMEEVSVELVFALLDEAAETLDTNETVTLAVNKYLLSYIEHMFPESIDELAIDENMITIHRTDSMPLWEQLRYLIFLSYLTERYSDYLITHAEVFGTGSDVSMYRADAFYFFSGFDDQGYETIQAFYADNVHHYVPSGTMVLSVFFEDIYIHVAYGDGLIHSIEHEITLYRQHLENK